MDSTDLLVISRSPGDAEAINSLLRNSGISIHTIYIDSLSEAEAALLSNPPILVIQEGKTPDNTPVAAIIDLAATHRVPVAVRCDPLAPELLFEAVTSGPCIALNRNDDSQLIDVVLQLLESRNTDRDIGEAQGQLEELEHRFQLLLNSARDPIAYIHEGLHVYANRAYLESMQVTEFDELGGLSILELMTGNDVDLKRLLREMNRGELPESAVSVTVSNPSGTQFQSQLTFTAAKFDGEDCIQMIMQGQDETSLLKSELERLRRTDHLTQVANRQTFMEHVGKLIEAGMENRSAYLIFYIEPDGFASLSAELGLSGSDQFLASFAKVIQDCIQSGDLAARISDHGFALLVNRHDPNSCMTIAECILENSNKQTIELDNKTIPASCSIGIATLGAVTRSSGEVLANAMSAHSAAAQSGNCYVRYKPKVADSSPDQQSEQWAKRIRYALNNRDMYTIQQSIVNLEGESEGLFENRTFLREDDGDRRPEEYMLIAEKHDLGSSIDRHVIPGLLNAISGSGDRHIINLSGNSVIDFSFPGWFSLQLDEHEVLGTQIILQIPAPAALSNLKPMRRLIEELGPKGCQFSIADFDDARENSQLLEHLEVSMVKLKSGFAQGLAGSADLQESIRNIVSETDNKGVSVIADEVLDASDLAVLWQCGVKLVAGEFLREAPQVAGQ